MRACAPAIIRIYLFGAKATLHTATTEASSGQTNITINASSLRSECNRLNEGLSLAVNLCAFMLYFFLISGEEEPKLYSAPIQTFALCVLYPINYPLTVFRTRKRIDKINASTWHFLAHLSGPLRTAHKTNGFRNPKRCANRVAPRYMHL